MHSDAPSASQTVLFHPNFNCEVFTVAFEVDGQGFKVDASRLTSHSTFIRDMLANAAIGSHGEGTVCKPIVVEGCSRETFANFMSWLNHHSWECPDISGVEGYLDVLHMTHMWEIKAGFNFAVKQLEDLQIRAAHCLHLARKYGILKWISLAVRVLLLCPFDSYTDEDIRHIGPSTVFTIAKGKEAISNIRLKLTFVTPYPPSFDSAPYCSDLDTCKSIWSDVWDIDMVRRINHPVNYFTRCLDTLRTLPHDGMHRSCRQFVLDWMETSCGGFRKEEKVICQVIQTITDEVAIHSPFTD